MDTYFTSGIIGGLLGGGVVAVAIALSPRRSCPRCSAPLPRFRLPVDVRQALFGGWVCGSCGARVGRDGEVA